MSNASFRIFRPKEFGRGRPLPYGWGFRFDALTKFGFEIITFKKDHEILSRGLREGMHCFTERCMIHP